jgi:mono/diheme cytochrome c family protein
MHRSLSTRRVQWLMMLAALLLLAWAPLTRAQVRPQPPERHNPLRAAYMRAHFYQAMLLHDAVARGNLETARLEATRLQQQTATATMPAGAEAFRGAIVRMAAQASAATTLPQAAQATSVILGTCGQCHRATQVRPMPPLGTDVKVGGIVGHMLLHQHGSDALVEGLVAPSDSAWTEGVRTFRAEKLDVADGPAQFRPQLAAAETTLAELAGEAARAQLSRDREVAYGKVLATCGGCHRMVAGSAGPDRR